jgi:serine/threonine-protein kinase HipA
MSGYRITSINDSIEPSKADLVAVAVKAGLNKKDAEEIFESIHAIIRKQRQLH